MPKTHSPAYNNFYCKNLCGERFSIEEWNKEYERCNKLGIEMPETEPCQKQCFECVVIVADHRNRIKPKQQHE